jgi:hypothetical protein
MKKFTWALLSVFVLSLAFVFPTFAADTGASASMVKTKAPILSADMVTCVQNAVDTRDTAIMGAIDAYATSVKAALSTRKDALKAAWAIPTAKDMKAALKTAWANYGVAAKAARTALNTTRKSAWSTFATARKACKAPASIDNAGSGADANL